MAHHLASPSNSMVVTLTDDGMVSSVSPETGRILGLNAVDVIGTPMTTILADRSAYEIPRILQSVRDSGCWDGELVCRNAQLQDVKVKASIIALMGQAGQLNSFALIAAPVENAKSDPARSEFSYQVGAKLRDIAHELNNPLAGVMGFAQLAMVDKHCVGPMRSHMEKLFTEVQAVIELVEELHHYAISLQRTSSEDGPRSDK